MTAKNLLRTVSVLILLFGVGHTLGYPWVGSARPELLSKLDEIRSMTSVTQGFTRSYWDFHVGFGLFISLTFLAQALLFWRLGSLAASEPRTAKLATVVFALLYTADVVLNFFYFFWAPIALSAAIAACLAWAAFAPTLASGASASDRGTRAA